MTLWWRKNNSNGNQYSLLEAWCKYLYTLLYSLFVVQAHDDCVHAWACDCPGYPGQSVQYGGFIIYSTISDKLGGGGAFLHCMVGKCWHLSQSSILHVWFCMDLDIPAHQTAYVHSKRVPWYALLCAMHSNDQNVCVARWCWRQCADTEGKRVVNAMGYIDQCRP